MHRSFLRILAVVSIFHAVPAAAATVFSFSSAGQEYGKAITVDANDNVIVAGLFQNTIDVDPGAGTTSLTAIGTSVDTVLAKYNSAGDLQWSTQIRGSGTEVPHGIMADATGNIFVTGYFGQNGVAAGAGNNASFDPSNSIPGRVVSSQGGFDAYLAKYNSSGTFQWAVGLGNVGQTTEERAWDIGLDTNGSVLVSGAFSGTVNFNPLGTANNLTAGSSISHFVSRYDSAGINTLAMSLDANINNLFTEGYTAVAPDSSGGFYVGGNYRGTTDFDPGAGVSSRISAGQTDIFIAHYSNSGALSTIASLGGVNVDILSPGAMRTGHDGNLYMTGRFTGPSDFNPGAGVTSLAGANDIFVASYDADLALRWVFSIPVSVTGSAVSGGHRIMQDLAGNVVVAGWFNGAADFDPAAAANPSALLTSTTGGDFFVAKYTATGQFLWAHNYGAADGSDQNIAAGLALDSEDAAWVTGQFYGTNLDFDPGPGTALLSSSGTNDLFIAKYFSNGSLASATPEPQKSALLLLGLGMMLCRRSRPRDEKSLVSIL